jgi:flavin reductase (DIM6/NTAB) family NADH-FMN oxidoreductase RutF
MESQSISTALSLIPYGFFAVTSRSGEDRNAMVLNWFSQVSFEPQHVVIGLQNNSYTMGLVKESKKFVVNIFRKEDASEIKLFTKSRKKNPDKFKQANYIDGPVTGIPILKKAAAYLECEIIELIDTGAGHSVVLAKVVGGEVIKASEVSDILTLPDLGWSYAG